MQQSPTIAALPERTPAPPPPQYGPFAQSVAPLMRARSPEPDVTAADVSLYRREVECKQQFAADTQAIVIDSDASIPPDNNRDDDDDTDTNGPYQVAGRKGRAIRATHI